MARDRKQTHKSVYNEIYKFCVFQLHFASKHLTKTPKMCVSKTE